MTRIGIGNARLAVRLRKIEPRDMNAANLPRRVDDLPARASDDAQSDSGAQTTRPLQHHRAQGRYRRAASTLPILAAR